MTFIISILKFILNVIYLFFKCFRTRSQITLISRQSNEITDDFKLLKDEFEKQLPDYKVVVLCKKMDNKFKYLFHMLKQMYNISRSKIVILDSYCIVISNLKHKKELKVIQIWHALGLVKKAGYAIIDKEEGRSSKVSKLLNMHKNYDYVFTTSEACKKAMSEVFGCDKNIVYNVPLPRIDLLKNKKYINSIKDKVYKEYESLKSIKTNVLYAPTFRKDEEEMQKQLDELIYNFDFEKYNLIIKIHPLSKLVINSDKVITGKFSTLDMMMVSDVVISDYSSMIYEAGILGRPQIFFAFDLNSYKGKRDFFINYEKEVPGPIVETSVKLIDCLDNKGYNDKVNEKFISKYVDMSIDNYTRNMVDKIKKIIFNEKM